MSSSAVLLSLPSPTSLSPTLVVPRGTVYIVLRRSGGGLRALRAGAHLVLPGLDVVVRVFTTGAVTLTLPRVRIRAGMAEGWQVVVRIFNGVRAAQEMPCRPEGWIKERAVRAVREGEWDAFRMSIDSAGVELVGVREGLVRKVLPAADRGAGMTERAVRVDKKVWREDDSEDEGLRRGEGRRRDERRREERRREERRRGEQQREESDRRRGEGSEGVRVDKKVWREDDSEDEGLRRGEDRRRDERRREEGRREERRRGEQQREESDRRRGEGSEGRRAAASGGTGRRVGGGRAELAKMVGSLTVEKNETAFRREGWDSLQGGSLRREGWESSAQVGGYVSGSGRRSLPYRAGPMSGVGGMLPRRGSGSGISIESRHSIAAMSSANGTLDISSVPDVNDVPNPDSLGSPPLPAGDDGSNTSAAEDAYSDDASSPDASSNTRVPDEDRKQGVGRATGAMAVGAAAARVAAVGAAAVGGVIIGASEASGAKLTGGDSGRSEDMLKVEEVGETVSDVSGDEGEENDVGNVVVAEKSQDSGSRDSDTGDGDAEDDVKDIAGKSALVASDFEVEKPVSTTRPALDDHDSIQHDSATSEDEPNGESLMPEAVPLSEGAAVCYQGDTGEVESVDSSVGSSDEVPEVEKIAFSQPKGESVSDNESLQKVLMRRYSTDDSDVDEQEEDDASANIAFQSPSPPQIRHVLSAGASTSPKSYPSRDENEPEARVDSSISFTRSSAIAASSRTAHQPLTAELEKQAIRDNASATAAFVGEVPRPQRRRRSRSPTSSTIGKSSGRDTFAAESEKKVGFDTSQRAVLGSGGQQVVSAGTVRAGRRRVRRRKDGVVKEAEPVDEKTRHRSGIPFSASFPVGRDSGSGTRPQSLEHGRAVYTGESTSVLAVNGDGARPAIDSSAGVDFRGHVSSYVHRDDQPYFDETHEPSPDDCADCEICAAEARRQVRHHGSSERRRRVVRGDGIAALVKSSSRRRLRKRRSDEATHDQPSDYGAEETTAYVWSAEARPPRPIYRHVLAQTSESSEDDGDRCIWDSSDSEGERRRRDSARRKRDRKAARHNVSRRINQSYSVRFADPTW